jgi:hypothetical protein
MSSIEFFMLIISRDKLQPTPNDSTMRCAYQNAVATILDEKNPRTPYEK